jgi:hypothetical protein
MGCRESGAIYIVMSCGAASVSETFGDEDAPFKYIPDVV